MSQRLPIPANDLATTTLAAPRELVLPCILVLVISLVAGVTGHIVPRSGSAALAESSRSGCAVADARTAQSASARDLPACH